MTLNVIVPRAQSNITIGKQENANVELNINPTDFNTRLNINKKYDIVVLHF